MSVFGSVIASLVTTLVGRVNVIFDISGGADVKLRADLVRNLVQSGMKINLIQVNTSVESVDEVNTVSELESKFCRTGGGTLMRVGFDLVKKQFNDQDTILVTDGLVDGLELYGINGNVVVLSTEYPCPVYESNGKLVQYVA